MSMRYKGAVLSATAPTTSSSIASGMWTIRQQLQYFTIGQPSAIGRAFGGGFYAGNIVDNGVKYALIVAPKSSGYFYTAGKTWGNFGGTAPIATHTLTNGPGASSSLNNISYVAAYYCEGLNIAGYTDWYLPSRDELEVLYRNLKPGTASNSMLNRANSNGFGGDSLGYGLNVNSSPVGAAYTASSPPQTSIELFKTGGTEAFEASSHWSSTEYDTYDVWAQAFTDGSQYRSSKESGLYVRAIRRVPI